MSNKHKLIPKRRFKEFANADAWEQRKLESEIKDFIVPMRDKPKEFGGDIPWTRIEDIEGKYLNDTLSNQYVTEETVHLMNLNIIPKDSLIVSSSATFGVVAIVTRDLVTNQTFIGLVPNDKNTLEFWYSFFHSAEARKYMRLESVGSTIFYIAREKFEKMPVKVPKIKEMMVIGEYFNKLDQLITLHQRKLYKLKILKSAYLSEIIPVEGELNPKRRFPGFAEDWEKKKVSDMFKVTRGQVLSMSLTSRIQDKTNKYPVYSSQTKDDGLMGYYSEYLFDTAITWTTDGANAGTVNYRKGKFFSTNVNGVLLSNDGYCNKAVSEILNLVAYKYVSKVGNPKLMNNVMEEIIISVPRDKNEMNIISDFLIAFDEKISFLQKKINKLEDLKKSYLNEMFV